MKPTHRACDNHQLTDRCGGTGTDRDDMKGCSGVERTRNINADSCWRCRWVQLEENLPRDQTLSFTAAWGCGQEISGYC